MTPDAAGSENKGGDQHKEHKERYNCGRFGTRNGAGKSLFDSSSHAVKFFHLYRAGAKLCCRAGTA